MGTTPTTVAMAVATAKTPPNILAGGWTFNCVKWHPMCSGYGNPDSYSVTVCQALVLPINQQLQ